MSVIVTGRSRPKAVIRLDPPTLSGTQACELTAFLTDRVREARKGASTYTVS